MQSFLTAIHLLISFALVVAVLLQSGKGGGLAGAFGGTGGAQTIFGGRGAATFLSKATAVLGALFLLSALLLAVLPRGEHVPAGSLLQEEAAKAHREAPPPSQLPPAEGTGILPGPGAGAPAVPEQGTKAAPEGARGTAGAGGQGQESDEAP